MAERKSFTMSLKGSFVEEKVIDNTGLYDALGIE